MKIKELRSAVNVCWSPKEHYPILIAAGAAAQQVDASFSSSSFLEIYSLNLQDPGLDLKREASHQTQHKFQKIAWSGAGTIVGGCDGGLIEFYNADKLTKNASDALVASSTKHTGEVTSLDVNPFQQNLLASGASQSEIFIWDLHSPAQPMTPGDRSSPHDQVLSLAWNQQVQHILASTFSTRCVVWDLRKNEPIMKLVDGSGHCRWRCVRWHPSVATQLCLASEEERATVQLWDLRMASSPVSSVSHHSGGVLDLAWDSLDPALMLSAGKDGRVLCWSPDWTGNGNTVSEVVSGSAWVHSVSWCPRGGGTVLTASVAPSVGVHAIVGGTGAQPPPPSDVLSSFGMSSTLVPTGPVTSTPVAPCCDPPLAPRWMKTPTRAKFAFGGKLVSFEKCPQEAGTTTSPQVYISQVVSEPEIVVSGAELDTVLELTRRDDPAAVEELAEYCRSRGDVATDQTQRNVWYFLRANFLSDWRQEVLNLLGFRPDEIVSKHKGVTQGGDLLNNDNNVDLITSGVAGLSRDAHTLLEKKIANLEAEQATQEIVIPNGDDPESSICRALICGRNDEAIELCLEADRLTDALLIASVYQSPLLSLCQRAAAARLTGPAALVAAGRAADGRGARGLAARSYRAALALAATAPATLPTVAEELCARLPDDPSAQLVCALVSLDAARVLPMDTSTTAGDAARSAELALLLTAAARRRGVELQGSAAPRAIVQYCARLAAQGCLRAALGVVSGPGVGSGACGSVGADLAERLRRAVGDEQRNVTNAPQQHTQHTQHRTSRRSTHGSVPQYEPQPYQPQSAPPSGAAPPAPGPQGSITTKSKYKLDPSVQSAPSYGQFGYNNPVQNQPGLNPAYSGYNPMTDQYGASTVPTYSNPTSYNQPNQGFNQQPGFNQPNPGFNQPNTGFNQPNTGYNQSNTGFNPPNAGFNQSNTGFNPPNAGFNQTNAGYSHNNSQNGYSENTQEAFVQSKPVPPGWNDPPMMTSKPKPKQEVQSQAPITHPLFGVEPPCHVPLVPGSQLPGTQIPGQFPGAQNPGQYPGAQIPGQFPGAQIPGQFPGAQIPGQFPGAQIPVQFPGAPPQGLPQQNAAPTYRTKTPTPPPRAPLPPEHACLQQTFDGLRTELAERATSAQTKRKLEDMQRRLETMYDLLRENKLSPTALSGLHATATAAASGQYSAAAASAAGLAAGGDFAAVAAFLPALRGLLQLAQRTS